MTSKDKLDFITSRLTNRDLNQLSFRNLKTGESISMKQCVEDIEKDLEVLDILKNNMVDINYFKESLDFGCDYNNSVGTLRKLLKNEKRLLQEWLENE